MILRHYRMMVESRPEHIAVREMRKHIGWYIRGLRDAARVRSEINRAGTAEAALALLETYFDHLESGKEEA